MQQIQIKGEHAVNSKTTRSQTQASRRIGRLLALLTILSLLIVPATALAQTPATNGTPGADVSSPGVTPEVYGPSVVAAPLDGSHVPTGPMASAPDAAIWLTGFCVANSGTANGDRCLTGDFNGDGKYDVIRFIRSFVPSDAGSVYVALSNGTNAFGPLVRWTTNFCVGSEECRVADVNGDRRDDIVSFVRGSTGNVWVALAQAGGGFGPSAIWRNGFCVSSASINETCDTGDFNGDGFDDIVAFHGGTVGGQAKVWIALSQVKQGTLNFGTPAIWNPSFDFCYAGEVCMTGDFNGDGKDDVVTFVRSAGRVWVASSNGSALNPASLWNPSPAPVFCVGSEVCGVGDFNGDFNDDVIAFTRNLYANKPGYVYVALSERTRFANSQLYATGFCTANTEICSSGDFNGDRSSDLLAFAAPSGNVWVSLSAAPAPLRKTYLPLIMKQG